MLVWVVSASNREVLIIKTCLAEHFLTFSVYFGDSYDLVIVRNDFACN